MSKRKRRVAFLGGASLVLALLVAVAAHAQTGALSQAPPTGCISEDGSFGQCTDGKALQGANSVATSPDGKNVYVTFLASEIDVGVAVFRRNTTTGELTQLAGTAGCVSEDGSNGQCTDGRLLVVPHAVTVSPDGTSVYVGSSGGVAVFQRNSTTGALTQSAGPDGCVTESGSGGTCTDGNAIGGVTSIAVSADGTSVYATSENADAVAAFQRNTATGGLTQLAGTAGCVSETGAAPCADGKALSDPRSVSVSPDGTSVYVASQTSDAVAAFQRNTTSGALTQLAGTAGCVSETGAGPCADGKALDGAFSVAVSPDGTSVYVASQVSDAVSAFRRNTTTGQLTQLTGPSGTAGCVSETAAGPCADGKALNGASSVAVSADGKHAYVASRVSAAVAVFSRNATTGQLTQLANLAGCVSASGAGPCAKGKALSGAASVAVSADGKNVYVASSDSNAVAIFRRNATFGTLTQLANGCISETGSGAECVDGKALDEASAVAVSPDGKNVYVASQASDAVAVFTRSLTTGGLVQLAGTDGCVSETGSGPCADGKGIDSPRAVAVSPDGEHVYVASDTSDAVAAFDRDTTDGALTQLAGTTGCVSETGSGGVCANGRSLNGARSLTVSPSGTHVYVASLASSAVTSFQRNTTTGGLSQLMGTAGCISEGGVGESCTAGKALLGAASVTTSANGANVYVASLLSDAVAVFRRTAHGQLAQLAGTAGCVSQTGTGGDCADGTALDGAQSVAVSPDGVHVYVGSQVSDAIAGFGRSSTNGALSQLAGTAGCISETGAAPCADGKALDGPASIAVSGDGTRVYAASEFADAVAAIQRNATTGALTQLAGTGGCISESGSAGQCVNGRGLDGARSVALSADGKNAYAASSLSDAVAVLTREP